MSGREILLRKPLSYKGDFSMPQVLNVAARHLSKKQIKDLKEKLLKELEKITHRTKESDIFCLNKNELRDVLDEANINIQAGQELRFRNREIFYLKKINQALSRIDEKVYGICEDCDESISYERLMARPTAELCISCKEEREQAESQSVFHQKSKSLGKSFGDMAGK